MNKLNVIKIGGSTISEWNKSLNQIKEIINLGESIVLVHGGGKTISDWSSRLGIRPEFVKGLRKTDPETLEIACAILSGLVNTKLVTMLESIGVNSVGFSGVSGKLLISEPKHKDLGLVGKILDVNSRIIISLIKDNFVPVISPLGYNDHSLNIETDGILNINADEVAAEIAKKIKASKIIYQTDVDGILDQNGRIIPNMTLNQSKEILNSGIISGGMIPKLQSCIEAIDGGVDHGHIINADNDSLIKIFKKNKIGTHLTK
jgi:acetylglutamate kinase